jgi:4-hydroxy-3-polyprenylbenzoate decarboxylase
MARQRMNKPSKPRLIVGITGASGTILGVRLLETLRILNVETHLVITRPARMTLHYETNYKVTMVRALADVAHNINDVGAPIASGSFRTLGMVIMPCSMKSLAEIATGITGNLLSRAADVVLKERRRLVLVPRETPLHAGHLRNMLTVTELGGVIMPPAAAFYNRPETIADIIDYAIGRVLDLFDLESPYIERWSGLDNGHATG